MKEKSIWMENLKTETYSSLKNDIECKILIIGGGIAGISTAFELKDEKDVVLIDKGKIGYGVTSHTTGKLTYLQSTVYTDIENVHGFKVALNYLNSQKEAINHIKDIISKYKIDCDLSPNDSYLFTYENKENLDKQKSFLKRAKVPFEETKLPINIPSISAIKVKDTYVFNPLKYINKLKDIISQSGVKIYENTTAIDLDKTNDGYIINTKNGHIKTKKLIICTHYPFFVIPGLMPLKLSLEKSYALSAPYKNQNWNAINIDKETYSIRFYKNNIIVGGYSHPLYNNLDYQKEEDKLINFFNKHFNVKPQMVWQTHDLTAHDYLPMIGFLNKKDPNLLIAMAFNKWGMTNGVLAGTILADLVCGQENKCENLFRIDRKPSLEKTLNFITNNFMIGKTYIGTKLSKNKPFYNHSYVTKIDGKSCGVYVDENGKKHVVSNICPHLKCSLIFNNSTKTWDCPCHGSRFDIDGNLIEGPSVFDIKIE